MKFMKLGSKPDIFQASGNIRSVSSEIPSDFIVVVHGVAFHLHKFPLLSKSAKLQKMASKAQVENTCKVHIDDFPGGVETFEICVKFCYGVKITVNAYNVVAVRSGAEYLEMNEVSEKGNLISKVESFLNSYIFHGWKDSIIALKSARSLAPWAEELQVVSRCINSIASKALVNPSKVDWSFTQTRGIGRSVREHDFSEISTHSPPWKNGKPTPHVDAHWWIEDIAELEIDMYSDVILAIKASDRMSPRLIGEAIEFYSLKWLPFLADEHHFEEIVKKNKGYNGSFSREHQLVERIICLLPGEKGCMSCKFLLTMLKIASFLGVSSQSTNEIIRRVGLQLEEASVADLLIPCFSDPSPSLYDVDLVQSIVEEFAMQDQSPGASPVRESAKPKKRRTKSAENINMIESRRSASTTHSSKLRVAKLIDSYLAEIAVDPCLEISKFISLAKSIPNFARPMHDGIYRAVDVYLKKHPGISKSERKRLCRLLDCKKLSMDACMHAAQNERLPLRTVVQVLFFEQVRNTVNGGANLNDLPSSVKALMSAQPETSDSHEGTSGGIDDKWEEVQQNFEALQRDLASMKVKLSEVEKEHSVVDQDSARSTSSSKSKKFLSRIWTGRGYINHNANLKSCCP